MEMIGIKNKGKRLENSPLRKTEKNLERRKRVVNRKNGRTISKIGGKPGKEGAKNTKRS